MGFALIALSFGVKSGHWKSGHSGRFSRHRHETHSVSVVDVLAGFVRAEVAPSVTSGSASVPGKIEAVADQTPNVAAQRVVSPVTAAKLAAAAPKFIPPASEPATTEPAASPVARAPEKPRNQIIRLPDFIVGEPKVHVPKPLDVLTPKGRIELALQRRPGLQYVPLAWMNAGIALAMLEDDLQAERRRQEAELWRLYFIK